MFPNKQKNLIIINLLVVFFVPYGRNRPASAAIAVSFGYGTAHGGCALFGHWPCACLRDNQCQFRGCIGKRRIIAGFMRLSDSLVAGMPNSPNGSDSQSAPFGLTVRAVRTRSPRRSDFLKSPLRCPAISVTMPRHLRYDATSSPLRCPVISVTMPRHVQENLKKEQLCLVSLFFVCIFADNFEDFS